MKEKICQLAQTILSQANNTEVSDKKYMSMTETQKVAYLQERSFINGQLSVINKVMEMIEGE